MGLVVLAYLGLINFVGFICMGIDKYKAQHHRWRIPEAALFAIAVLGGSIGCGLGMLVFRHKTKKVKFIIGIPLIFIIELALCIYTNGGPIWL